MGGYSLSEGTLRRIMLGEKITDPVMQILGSKKINSNSSDKERYRVLLSDGKHSISFAMLTTQASAGEVEKFSIIKLVKYITSEINNASKGNTKILLILEMQLIASGSAVGAELGSPSALSSDLTETRPTGPTVAPVTRAVEPAPTSSSINSTLNQSISDTKMVSPISSLTPYHNKWVIKARVASKSDMRTWSNSRGEGKLFNVDLIDESGEIRCTAFRDMADKYFHYLEVDKVYYFSKCQLKPANKQFSTLKNEYEMTMTSETIIEECHSSDIAVPQVKYNFVPICEIGSKDTGSMIDVIGVCKSASDVQTFTSRASNRELKKREVYLVDQSNTAITLTLWGSQAENFDATGNPVIVIKGAKVGEFGGGKNVSTLMSSVMKTNPDIPECHRIKGWFDSEGRDVSIKNISEKSGVGNFQTTWMNIKEVQERGLGRSEKGDYYQLMATILLIRSENCIYKACPTPECNKKVIDLENGMYRCEKCTREFPNFKYRLLMSMNIGDWSGHQWVSMFSDEAEKILGKTAQEVGTAMENDSEAATKIFQDAHFKQFIFKCRAKLETYNDEERLKTVAVRVDPLRFEEHNEYMIGNIEKWLAEN